MLCAVWQVLEVSVCEDYGKNELHLAVDMVEPEWNVAPDVGSAVDWPIVPVENGIEEVVDQEVAHTAAAVAAQDLLPNQDAQMSFFEPILAVVAVEEE